MLVGTLPPHKTDMHHDNRKGICGLETPINVEIYDQTKYR